MTARASIPLWFADLSQAGFADIESFSFDLSVPYSHEAWLGRIRASAGVAASLPPDAVERFNAAHRALLATHFPADPLHIPHRVFAVSGRARLNVSRRAGTPLPDGARWPKTQEEAWRRSCCRRRSSAPIPSPTG